MSRFGWDRFHFSGIILFTRNFIAETLYETGKHSISLLQCKDDDYREAAHWAGNHTLPLICHITVSHGSNDPHTNSHIFSSSSFFLS